MASSIVRTTPSELMKKLQKNRKATRRAVSIGLLRGAHRGKSLMTRNTPVDQGQLKASWRVRKPVGDIVKAELINDAPHAGIVEMGARPHKVSAEGWAAIYEWVRRHFGFTTTVRSGKNKGKQSRMKKVKGDTGEDPGLSEITWGIVKKIEREGQLPTWFVRKRLPQLHNITIQEIVKQLEKMAKKKGGEG